MISAYPKILAVGAKPILSLLDGEVECSEKIDGSQFCIGKIDDVLFMRSKGAEIFPEAPPKMFALAVSYINSIKEKLPNNMIFYCEYLGKPKHNLIAYDRVPKNNLILFGASTHDNIFLEDYYTYAEELGIEAVPILYKGVLSKDRLLEFLETDSVLGGSKIEGIVIKNYNKDIMIGDRYIPLLAGKFVSEKFKEVMQRDWKKEHTTGGQWDSFKEQFCTPARWEKAIQHLEEKGELEHQPKDIGKLIAEIKNDISEEEREYIKEVLWNSMKEDLLRRSIRGFPEYYKLRLLEGEKP